MASINKITVLLTTANETGAGTDGWVYLGIAGREFVVARDDVNDTEQGSEHTYVFGVDANVQEAEYNDPRKPQLKTENLSVYPTYIRFEPEGSAAPWYLERVTVKVNPDGSDSSTFDNMDLLGAAKLWLGQEYGKMLYLQRQTGA
ncbi:PLAT/LH2 domain-containing protein [Streptomyces sp. NPDC054874]